MVTFIVIFFHLVLNLFILLVIIDNEVESTDITLDIDFLVSSRLCEQNLRLSPSTLPVLSVCAVSKCAHIELWLRLGLGQV